MARSKVQAGSIGFWNTALRYYLGLDPATLTIEQWAKEVAYLELIRNQEKASGL